MTLSERRRRLDAHAWVHRICILFTIVAGVMTVPALFVGFGLGAPWLVRRRLDPAGRPARHDRSRMVTRQGRGGDDRGEP